MQPKQYLKRKLKSNLLRFQYKQNIFKEDKTEELIMPLACTNDRQSHKLVIWKTNNKINKSLAKRKITNNQYQRHKEFLLWLKGNQPDQYP